MHESNHPRQLLVIYHSMTGGAAQMACACAQAAAADNDVVVNLKAASQTSADDFLAAHGYIFATPEYLGSMSGIMKDCFDRSYYHVVDRVQARPYATMVCAGSDGQGAAKQIERILTGWRLKAITEPLIVNVDAQTPETILAAKQLSDAQLTPCKELGQLMAHGLSMSIF